MQTTYATERERLEVRRRQHDLEAVTLMRRASQELRRAEICERQLQQLQEVNR